ncbi:17895_t:CDS:1, partial [Gigaspora rosea]
FAINIKKYGDDKWIGTDENSWPVSFHGTRKEAAENIVKDGYDLLKSPHNKFGTGIYSTPNIKIAEAYATVFTYQNCEYKVIFQNRVHPDDLHKVNDDKFWLTLKDRNVRPYGLCIKK